MSVSPPFVSIVIPFYQRETGILARALRSVLGQLNAPAYEVVVVDDTSPLSAVDEVAAAGWGADPRIRVVKQANAGPGAARNTGLDNASPQATYIAFLDSDDQWAPEHLQRAVAALEQGYDAYFANHLELGATTDAFTLRAAQGFDVSPHPSVPSVPGVRSFEGDMFDQILRMNIIETSTVVYRFAPLRTLRFKPDFRYAFEDYLFWIELARATPRFVFSTQLDAFYGSGVNIYKSAGYGTDGAARRTAETTRFFTHLRDSFPLTRPQRRRVNGVLAQLRHDFAADMLHRIRHRKPVDWHWARRQVSTDGLSGVMLPINWAAIVSRQLFGGTGRSS